MNDKNSIKELLDQLSNSTYWVKRIVAAHLDTSVDKIDLTKLKGEKEND